ncbi:N-acetylmuramate alpha-1-phosphate uridylyltransferase MurU [Paludibacterium paludis]|uniref:Mannose-1-phosphate guanylyltransferase n=1 Tax=Paludibacterium paludis TaxID=1225769 RepID=A0A918U8Q7_9NEIS|nr:nucleotidyltransferase family protein [Paludibacterium paludis]GGY10032.1 mannose-1-phosphate guanylyltransferase [Paludibacterium paludis]
MKAMILAAGRGERMRPLTDHTPKPLLKAGGESLMGWHIRRLARAGFSELVVNHAWLGEQIEAAFGDGSAYGVSISWSREAQALETAGGIANALPLLGGEPFVLINGDVLADIDFGRLAEAARGLDGVERLAHLVMVPNPAWRAAGDFDLGEDGFLTEGTSLTFAGAAAYHPAMFAGMPPGQAAPMLPLFRRSIKERQITGHRHDGLWLDVGTPERLREADRIATGRDWA